MTLNNDEASALIDAHKGWAILTTLGKNGYPHSIPLAYFRDGDEVYFNARASSQRLVNVEREPRVTLLFESGTEMADLRGLMLQGDATVVRDDAERLRLARAGAQRRGVPEAEWPTESPEGLYIRVERRHLISWDYS